MSTLADKVLEFLNRFPEPKAKSIADFFTGNGNETKQKQVQTWLNGQGNPPMYIAEAMMDDFQPESLAEQEEPPNEDEQPGEGATDVEVPNSSDQPSEINAVIAEIFGRLDAIDGVIDELLQRADIHDGQIMEMATGRPIPQGASRLRPGGSVPFTGFDPNDPPRLPAGAGQPRAGFGARRVPPANSNNGYAAGVATGRAPSRQQAHWSSQGQRGNMAQPAQQRRAGSKIGNRNWNTPKAVMDARKKAALAKVAAGG